jgi:phosphatidylglycerophosphatase C
MTHNIAVFDFDDTLVVGDSLWPFLTRVAGGTPRALLALAKGMLHHTSGQPVAELDQRGRLKQALLRHTLAGRSLPSLAPALAAMAHWPRWKQPILDRLHQHKAEGCHILIASGGLALYLPTLLHTIPYDGLLCTEMAVRDDQLTGLMQTGNCVRAEKARRVAAYLAAHGPFTTSWGYGNAPHDLPMLELLTHRMVV